MSSCGLPGSCLFHLCLRDKFRSPANLPLCSVANVFLHHGWEKKNNQTKIPWTFKDAFESLHTAATFVTKLFCQKQQKGSLLLNLQLRYFFLHLEDFKLCKQNSTSITGHLFLLTTKGIKSQQPKCHSAYVNSSYPENFDRSSVSVSIAIQSPNFSLLSPVIR